ncbi:MAG: carbohydrate-binding family 9-like protein [Acidobacteria bacterium]|nr:carbohydrate-binding family 9-like protein [Acidobacteriota bacterium]
MMLFLVLFGVLVTTGQTHRTFESARAERDFELTADPDRPEWKDAPRVFMTRDYLGGAIDGAPTEVRSRWTNEHLYLLYICPYYELNLKPEPPSTEETPRLWDWDVVEAFIGSNDQEITRYKEFQVSPRGEWLDMDIDRQNPKGQAGIKWSSGFTARARIDTAARIWYGELRIPFRAVDGKPPRVGRQLRLGLYRIARVKPSRMYYAWQPTGQTTFHVPEAFGTLSLR